MRSVRMLAVLTAAAVLLAVAPVRVAARPAEPYGYQPPRYGEPLTLRVFATRIGLVGERTANGHVIVERDRFVALPSRRALSSRDGYEFTVTLTYRGRTVTAPVWDVGPWNIADDYWNPPEIRERFADLPQGMPQAQAAFETGHNGGRDQFGRTVRNPAGIDLADGTFWDDLGMVDNDWVEVRFDWTAAPTPAAG